MYKAYLNCGDTCICVNYPSDLFEIIEMLFPYLSLTKMTNVNIEIAISKNKSGHYDIWQGRQLLSSNLPSNDCALSLCNEVINLIARHNKKFIAFHAAGLAKSDRAIILPAKTGGGKTSLAAWLTAEGYEYLTDELVLLNPLSKLFEAIYRPLNIKTTGQDAVQPLQYFFQTNTTIETQSVTLLSAFNNNAKPKQRKQLKAGLFIFPNFTPQSKLQIEPLTPAQTGLALMACNVNARNVENHGFNDIAEISKVVPAIRLTYSQFQQLENVLPNLIDLIVSSSLDMKSLNTLVNCGVRHEQTPIQRSNVMPVPRATPKRARKKLCIGMATYDDYDGVYFTIQAIRLYHPEIIDELEFLIIDNHPTGICAQELKALDGKIKNLRYLPVLEKTGTGVRDVIFKQANSDYVLCIDCHVFIHPGSIKKLLNYFSSNPQTGNLLQGPMYSDDLNYLSTHFDPVWRNGMYGIWAQDQRGLELNAPAFAIPMQGLGLFASRADSWPGLNESFRGFGGEEGYIHEKYRRNGHETLCLPFLRWVHRFARPHGVPYAVNWADRIRNYLIGFTELGLDINPVINHFNAQVGEALTTDVLKSFTLEFSDSNNQ